VPDGAARRADDERLAGLRRADLEQAEVGGEAVDPEQRQVQGGVDVGGDDAGVLGPQHGVVLPTGRAGDEVADGDPLRVGRLDSADAAATHHDAGHRGAGVAGAALQAGALAGADRDRQRAGEDLAVARFRRRRGDELVVVLGERTARQRPDQDLTVVGHGRASCPSRHTGPVLEPAPVITCIDCGGRAHLLSAPHVDPEDGSAAPWEPGDVVAYRCEDCLDRWDLVLEDDDSDDPDGR
jgi:hypothetical protein